MSSFRILYNCKQHASLITD